MRATFECLSAMKKAQRKEQKCIFHKILASELLNLELRSISGKCAHGGSTFEVRPFGVDLLSLETAEMPQN